jgi:arylsulfatase A-like enzyme
LRDLAATLSALAVPNDTARFAGASLVPLWSDGAAPRSVALALVEQGVRRDSTLPFARGDMVSLADSFWHFVRNNGTGEEELFRYREDPAELEDYADAPEGALVLAGMRARVNALLSSAVGASAIAIRDDTLDRRGGAVAIARRLSPCPEEPRGSCAVARR